MRLLRSVLVRVLSARVPAGLVAALDAPRSNVVVPWSIGHSYEVAVREALAWRVRGW